MNMTTSTAAPSETVLLADLAATFPGLDARPVSEFIADRRHMQTGAWFTQPASMPDGLPIFLLPMQADYQDPEGYSCFIHDGFLEWLKLRGWFVDTYDYAVYLVLPDPAFFCPVEDVGEGASYLPASPCAELGGASNAG